jgi:DNA-binding FrmR family transcriptional regulator
MAHTKSNKDALLARVRRISGQMAAIEKAISDNAACNTILHQVAGVRGAVGGLMDELIGDHIQQHLAQPGLSDAERAEAADDIIAAIRRYAK